MTFIQSLLQDPTKTIRSYPTKQIDTMSHDFDSEPLPERLYSIYSALNSDLNTNTIFKLKSYKDELEFLKLVNKPSYHAGGQIPTLESDVKRANKAWLELKSKDRNSILEKVLV